MTEARPAGFWIRALALAVDFIVFAFVQFTFSYGAARVFGPAAQDDLTYQSAVFFFTLIFTLLYTSAMHATAGQTIGKMLTWVQVVGADGEPPTFGTAVLRYIGYYASFFTFTLGFIMAALRRDKRALHDLIAGTWVVRVPRVAPAPPPPPAPPAPEPEEPPVMIADDRSTSGYV
jgi:uncharacterized RDD family membrane protein YckC